MKQRRSRWTLDYSPGQHRPCNDADNKPRDHVDAQMQRDETRLNRRGTAESAATHVSNVSRDQTPSSESSEATPLVGPLPPSTTREPKLSVKGRGSTNKSGGISSRFDELHDPFADAKLKSTKDDQWSMAVEAFRARQSRKQHGAERLRQAGFSGAQISRGEKGDAKDETDVRWAKKGEAREWDRGKVFDDDGQVELKPEWGRLKDT